MTQYDAPNYTPDEAQKSQDLGFTTQAIHAGHQHNTFGALCTPIYQTSTYVFDSAEQGGRRFAQEEGGYIYGRLGNPTVAQVEQKIARLEGAEAAVAMSSGMGAISSLFWTILKAGDHIIAPEVVYGCTFAYFEHGLKKFGVEVSFVDMSNLDNVRAAMRPNTRAVYIETPANPTLILADIEAIADIAHQIEDCLVIVDNTFCTPYLQRPLEFGADVVVHSATKYLNGHGDVIAGFVCGKQQLMTEVLFVGVKDMTGSVLSPNDAFLINRGLKTLPLRMDKHCDNAQKVAEFLQSHPAIQSVTYPGLSDFPQQALAKKQMRLNGGVISFEIAGTLAQGKQVMDAVKLCKLAVSLGDAETLIQHPASMTHSPYTEAERAEAGIPDGLIRLSVGLEDVQDIISDLKQALDSIM